MRFLIDTHIFIWFFREPELLSSTAAQVLGDERNTILLSVASIWEMQIKVDIGKLTFEEPLLDVVALQQKTNGIQLLPIEVSHINALSGLPMHHRDPFDRLIIPQSIVENMPLLSADKAFDLYPAQILR